MKEKFFHMFGKAVDSAGEEHIITVVGKFNQFKEIKNTEFKTAVLLDEDDGGRIRNGNVTVPIKRNIRSLKIGYSICHPNDEFNEEIGVNIAKHRINRGDFIGELTSNNITMLNDDQCNLMLFGELQYIIKNIDKYLPEICEDFDPNDEVCQTCTRAPHVTENWVQGELFSDTDFEDDNKEAELPQAPNFDELPNLN